jgi:hypothetical protein
MDNYEPDATELLETYGISCPQRLFYVTVISNASDFLMKYIVVGSLQPQGPTLESG